MNSQVESDRRVNLWRVIHATWIVLALVALGVFVASLPAYALRGSGAQSNTVYDASPVFVRVTTVVNVLASIAAALISLGLAFILFRHKQRDPMAMYVSFYLLVYGVVAAGPLGMLDGSRPMTESAAILAETVLLTTPTITLFFIFPTGQFVPHWTRWASVLSVVWIGAGFAFVRHPPAAFDFWSLAGMLVSIFTYTCFAMYAPIYRYRRVSNLVERQQTKWVVFGMTLFLALTALTMIPYFITQTMPHDMPRPLWALAMGPLWWLSLNILPLSLTIAVMRYRLFQIDLIINRALVYGALTAFIIALYVLVVGGLGALFQSSGNFFFSLLATGVIALLVNPLRLRLQHLANRLMYGERDDPYKVLSQLSQHLEATQTSDSVLSTIVETIAQTLKLPYAAILLADGKTLQTAAITGSPTEHFLTLTLTHQHQTIGELHIAQRSPNEPFTPAERHLLEDIAAQTGVAVHNVRLTADLQRSREQIVAAREEERLRLRRDLHDGLGPKLAGQTLKLEAAMDALDTETETARTLLKESMTESQTLITEIRRLVYGLRPPALDQLGLLSAIREQAAGYQMNGLQVTVSAPDSLPSLPAAVEVAAYRIVQEALTNVSRHARAKTCNVSLAINKDLEIVISDDGIGLPKTRKAGVGLSSMRERAEEIGGTCVIESATNNGTRVIARLPISNH